MEVAGNATTGSTDTKDETGGADSLTPVPVSKRPKSEQLDPVTALRNVFTALVSEPTVAERIARVQFDPEVLQIAIESVFALPEFGRSGIWITALCSLIAQYAVMADRT